MRALVSGIMAAMGGASRRQAPQPMPSVPVVQSLPVQRRGNNRKHALGSRAKRARWRMECASRARNLGQSGQRKKRSR
jgi:hypothetical protein